MQRNPNRSAFIMNDSFFWWVLTHAGNDRAIDPGSFFHNYGFVKEKKRTLLGTNH